MTPIGRRSPRTSIDFDGRTGYVRTAIEAGVPIVPMVSIGGQETQLFLARGDSIARRLGLKRLRVEILPISIGFPFGLSVFFPPNLPLPAKIVTRVLEPDRHRGGVRRRSRRRDGRPARPGGDAASARRIGPRTPLPGAGLTDGRRLIGLLATLWRARLIAPMRPDRYLRMGAAMRRVGMTATVGFAAAAQRCPDRPG